MPFRQKHPILADMDRRDAGSGNRHSCNAPDCPGGDAGNLSACRRALELDRATDADHRNLAPLPAAETAECRNLLAKLIACRLSEAPDHIAGQLIERFGSLPATLQASPKDRIAIVGDAHLEPLFLAFHHAMGSVLRKRITGRPLLSTETAVLNYLRAIMGFAMQERFHILFLDAGNRLVADELLATGTVSSVHIYPREVLKRCLELGATAMILVHNHPSGCFQPSNADRDMTRRIVLAATSLDIMIHDHIIITPGGSLSFRSQEYL